jgi:protein gp37
MGKKTAISWTGRTWNPTTGCDKISAGCDNCYALSLAPRLKAMQAHKPLAAQRYARDGNPLTSGPGFGLTMHADLVDAPRFWKKPDMVFVNSMSDLFHAGVDLGFVRDVFATMEATPQHIYQVLTKRSSRLPKIVDKLDWPENLWMGVSVENAEAMYRIEDLKAVPTSVRFLSAEPLIGPLIGLADRLDGIDWVIVGGESGPNFRPLDLDWARDIRDACAATNTAYFFKQVGGVKSKSGGKLLDGEELQVWPVPDKTRCRTAVAT